MSPGNQLPAIGERALVVHSPTYPELQGIIGTVTEIREVYVRGAYHYEEPPGHLTRCWFLDAAVDENGSLYAFSSNDIVRIPPDEEAQQQFVEADLGVAA
ncbi:MAG: hypothetical protein EVA65_15755 [Oceanococcus sp.]|nr:MAG: hypothetical protein EVA65_15755 [Oceanococcus sp.]